MYFLLNYRLDGVNHLLGAEVASVNIVTYPPVPAAQRLSQYWWDGEIKPCDGDAGAIHSGDYMYAYGRVKVTPYASLGQVLCRKATDLSYHEYWNGDYWQTNRSATLERRKAFSDRSIKSK